MTHICVVKLTIIGSDNGFSPGRRQVIIWANAGILLIGPLGTNFSEILIGILTFSFKKMHLKMSSAKWRPFCLGLNVLRDLFFLVHACVVNDSLTIIVAVRNSTSLILTIYSRHTPTCFAESPFHYYFVKHTVYKVRLITSSIPRISFVKTQFSGYLPMYPVRRQSIPESKVHGANIGPIWSPQDPGGPHVGPMNLAIWDM